MLVLAKNGKKKTQPKHCPCMLLDDKSCPLQFQPNKNKMGAEESLSSPALPPGCINSRRPCAWVAAGVSLIPEISGHSLIKTERLTPLPLSAN